MPNAFCIVSVTGNNPYQFLSKNINCKNFSCSVSTNRNLIGGLGCISHPESRGATTKLMPVRYFKYGFLSVSEGSDYGGFLNDCSKPSACLETMSTENVTSKILIRFQDSQHSALYFKYGHS